MVLDMVHGTWYMVLELNLHNRWHWSSQGSVLALCIWSGKHLH